MALPYFQVNHFYDIWLPLLQFVNQKMGCLSQQAMQYLQDYENQEAENILRTALWENAWLIDDYLKENPNKLNNRDLSLIESWKLFHYGDFTLCKVIRSQGIFAEFDEPRNFYSVCPLFSRFEDLFPEFPLMVRTAIIPFENVLIYDGLVAAYPVQFGSGLRGIINEAYQNAKELGNIITSLPHIGPKTKEEKLKQTEKTNQSVLRYFRSSLRFSGHSEKIINRDVDTAKEFAVFLISEINETTSLRHFDMEGYQKYLAHFENQIPRSKIVGLKRLINFLQNTERIEWDIAEDIYEDLKSL